jgi:integration host factor subunit alpha
MPRWYGGKEEDRTGAHVIKADIVERVHQTVGFSKREAEEVVEVVFGLIKETLERGENVKISGFGHLAVRNKKARVGRNPQTGADCEICARRVVTFKASGVLRIALNAGADARAQVKAGGVSSPAGGTPA